MIQDKAAPIRGRSHHAVNDRRQLRYHRNQFVAFRSVQANRNHQAVGVRGGEAIRDGNERLRVDLHVHWRYHARCIGPSVNELLNLMRGIEII
jgi:hypothetical protein